MPDVNLLQQKAKIHRFSKGFIGMHVLDIGLQLGFFDKLISHQNGLSAKELANVLDLQEHCVNIWCQTAYHLKILECNESDQFMLHSSMATLLTDTDSAFYDGYNI